MKRDDDRAPMSIRFPGDIKKDLKEEARSSGLSQNAIVIIAVKDFFFRKKKKESK